MRGARHGALIALALVVGGAVAVGLWLVARRRRRGEGYAEYSLRVWDDAAGWKCPDGYTDTGHGWDSGENREKHCRKKTTDKKAKRFMRRKLAKAKEQCGPRPGPVSDCTRFKCQKVSDGRYKWVCVSGKYRDEMWMGCSTDGTEWNRVWYDPNAGECRQYGHASFPLSKCCEGPAENMDKVAPGHRTCPGRGKTERDGC